MFKVFFYNLVYGQTCTYFISDFEQTQKIWTDEKLLELIKKGSIGSTPETAIVPIVFDIESKLLNSCQYNASPQCAVTYYFTDISTFSQITNELTSTSEYAQVLTYYNEQAIFAYDPYSKIQQTREQVQNQILLHKQLVRPLIYEPLWACIGTNWSQKSNYTEKARFELGDILIRVNSNELPGTTESQIPSSNYWGHTSVITTGAESDNAEYLMKKAYNMEALGYEKPATQLWCRPVYDYWHKVPLQERYCLKPRLSKEQQQKIVDFVKKQDKDTYGISRKRFKTSKPNWADSDEWYCSLLAWQTYLYIANIDIDSNGGTLVFPNDILNSAYFTKTYF